MTSTEIDQRPEGDLTGSTADRGIHRPGDVSAYTPEERDRLRAVQNIGDASDADLYVLGEVSRRTGLDPFLKEVWLVGRKTKTGGYRGEPERWETKFTVQVGIDGFRKTTIRYADQKGVGFSISRPTFYDKDGNPRPFWPDSANTHPEACEVTVTVGQNSATHVVTWDEYVQTKDEWSGGKKTGRKVPNTQWTQYGPTQLAKCAEAGAHRRVCPLASGMYEPAEIQPTRVTAERVDQAPAPGAGAQGALAALTERVTDDFPVDAEVDGTPAIESAADRAAGAIDRARSASQLAKILAAIADPGKTGADPVPVDQVPALLDRAQDRAMGLDLDPEDLNDVGAACVTVAEAFNLDPQGEETA